MVDRAVFSRAHRWVIAALLALLLLTATILAVTTEQQDYDVTLGTEQAHFTASVTRFRFFPDTCVRAVWQSEGLAQVLINGQIADRSGSLETCAYGDVITSFQVVSQDYRSAEFIHARVAGASGLLTVLMALAVAYTLIAPRLGRRERSAPSPSPEAPAEIPALRPLLSFLRATLPFIGVLALLQIVFPIAFRDSWATWLTYWLYLTFGVILPGTLLILRVTRWRADWLTWLGLGWAVGHGIELFALQAAKALGVPALFLVWIPVVLAWTLLSQPDWTARLASMPRRWRFGWLVVVVLGGLVFISLNLAELSPRPPFISDVWFHINNAHEFRDHLVTQDPRLAGELFNYHMFGYAPYAAASIGSGAPVAHLLSRYAGLSAVWLLGLLLFNAGRSMSGGLVWAGVLAALLVLTPIDPLALFSVSLSPSAMLPYFGVYISTTTLAGHIYLAALLLPIGWYLTGGRLRDGWVIVLLTVAGAGSKSMFGPLIVCGALGVVGWDILRRRFPARALVLVALVSLPVALITVQLVFGPGSYAESIQWQYASFSGFTRFYAELSPYLGDVAARSLWLLGFGGLCVIGALEATWVLRRANNAGYIFVFAWMLFAASLIPAMGIALKGASQLFFLYYGLAALAPLAGYGLIAAARWFIAQPAVRTAGGLVALLLFMMAQYVFVPPNMPFEQQVLPIMAVFSRTFFWLPVAFSQDTDLPRSDGLNPNAGVYMSQMNMTEPLAEGLDWARLNLGDEAVFAVNVPEASVYAGLSEVRAFYETDAFSVRSHIAGSENGYFQPRRDLISAWRDGADGVVEQMRASGITHLFVDSVNGFAVPNRETLSPVFENSDFAIYALADS